jgi:hypothetical protein
MFVDDKGDGLLTAGGARAGKALFMNVIDKKKSIPGTNWPEMSKDQKEMNAVSAGYGMHWKFKGNVYRSIVARKVGKGWTIGLKNKTVTITRFGGKTAKMPVMKYAAYVEFGTEWQKARPLFLPVSIHYNKNIGKALSHVVDSAITSLIEEYTVEKVSSKYATSTEAGGGISQSSLDAANPEGDFDSTIINNNFKNAELAAGGVNITKFVGKAGLTAVEKVKKNSYKSLEKDLRGVAGDHEQLENAKDWLSNNADLLKGFD